LPPRQTAPLLARPRRFYRRVKRQDIGLERNAVDDGGDLGDFFELVEILPMVLTTPETIWPPRLAFPEASSASLLA
jgi:hypothetical protein